MNSNVVMYFLGPVNGCYKCHFQAEPLRDILHVAIHSFASPTLNGSVPEERVNHQERRTTWEHRPQSTLNRPLSLVNEV